MLMYNRDRVVAYARRWAFSRNPMYYDFSMLGGDCTNFASQCIYAGSQIMNYTPVTGWYYINLNDRSPSWTGVEELYRFLTNNRGSGPVGEETELINVENGDLIQIKFEGMDRFSHTPVVVDKGEGTVDTILVAAHSRDAFGRPLSSYNYEELRAIHILGVNE